MKNNIYIKIIGHPEDIKELTAMLEKKNIHFRFALKEIKPLEKVEEKEKPAIPKYSRQIRIMQLLINWKGVLNEVVVILTGELIKAIVNWLKERRKKGMKKPRLKVEVEGNILDLNQKNMKILKKILEESK